jgi:hypothetical protein
MELTYKFTKKFKVLLALNDNNIIGVILFLDNGLIDRIKNIHISHSYIIPNFRRMNVCTAQ